MRAAWTFVLGVALVLATCRLAPARRPGRTPHLDAGAAAGLVAARHHVARPHRMPTFTADGAGLRPARAGRIADTTAALPLRAPSFDQTVPVARGPPCG